MFISVCGWSFQFQVPVKFTLSSLLGRFAGTDEPDLHVRQARVATPQRGLSASWSPFGAPTTTRSSA